MARTAWAANAIPVELTGKHHALTNDAGVAANGQSVHLPGSHCPLFPHSIHHNFQSIYESERHKMQTYVETGGTWPVQLVQAALLLNNLASGFSPLVTASC